MAKGYSNRQMKNEDAPREQTYFFPKATPPVAIEARSRNEAEEKLKALNNKEHE